MKRFQGQPLGAQPKIAVIANDALGNYVVSTPLLQMLRAKYGDATITYFSGKRVQEFWSRDPKIDVGIDLIGADHPAELATEPFDLAINIEVGDFARAFATQLGAQGAWVCGPVEGSVPFPDDAQGDLWRDQEWISEDLTERYPFLPSGFIGDIFCRLAYLDGPIPRYEVPKEPPPMDIPEVLIATAASLPEKLWPADKWIELVRRIAASGRSIGLLGAKPSAQRAHWQGGSAEDEIVASGHVADLRGKLTLPEVVGALARTSQVVTLDNGILHLAVAAGTPTIGLYRRGIHRLWAPPAEELTIIIPPGDATVAEIPVDEVICAN